MAKLGKIGFDNPTSIDEEENDETLAAIDEGIRDVKAGRVVPTEGVRKRVPQWITASSSRKAEEASPVDWSIPEENGF